MSTRSQDHLSSEEWKALSKNNMAKEIVIFPGGFHPIHPGHVSVYNALKKVFPAAEVYIASSDSTKERPFPFDDKKVLATAAGIPTDKFVEVVSPYKAMEITKNYDPSKDLLIFGLSAKDASRLSYTKKDGTAGYFQKYVPGTVMDPFEQHAYVYIAPTVTFKLMGQAVSSASIIRKMYGEADDAGKYEILKELYPKGDPKKIKTIFDRALTTSESTMPPRYKAGLSASTAKKRRVFWTKLGKYPYSKSEYEKAKHAPGDSKETTPSKYTTAYKNKFGEDLNENAALDKTLATKSKASGIPRGILRQVYNRGMAAWVTGHRPGASQQAWGMGRVNSFIVKGKTWHTTDSDLAKKVRSDQVDEAHDLDYLYWGWIGADGKIYDKPKSTHTMHAEYVRDILIDISNPNDATDNFDHTDSYDSEGIAENLGWVRFFLTSSIIEMFFSVYLQGFKLTPKIYTAIKQVLDRAHKLTKMPIFRSYNFENSIDRPLNPIEVADPDEFLKKLRNKYRGVSEMNEDIVHSKKGWTLFSKKTHKRLGGPYDSKEQAIKRERQVAYFKHMSENNIKTFKQFSEEQEDLYIDPKGDQEVILELDIPSEVKKNIDAGFDLLKQNDNKGANSSIIAFAKKLQSGEQADKDMLALWQAKFKIHQTSKDRGWGKTSDKELQQLLAKATPDGYIPWMLLGGNEGKKFVDDALQSLVKEESLNEVSPEGIAAMRRMGIQNDPEGALARSNYERITKTKWSSPEDINKKQPTPAAKPTPPSPTSNRQSRQSEFSSFLRQIDALGFFFIKQEPVPGKQGMLRLDYSNTGKIHRLLRGWDLRLYNQQTGPRLSQGNLGWYLFSPVSETEEYDSGKTLRQFLASIQEVLDIDK